MSSWQAEILNFYLSTSTKVAFKHVKSISTMRNVSKLVDFTVGTLFFPSNLKREKVEIPGAEYEAEWLDVAPENGSRRVVLYLPGGGYILRLPNASAMLISRACKEAGGARILMAYYRLAPEHPFPACVEDSVKAYRWLLDQGIKPEDIIIGGESAGGGLTLSTLLAIRDQGLPVPAGGLMLSPVLDFGDGSASRWKNASSDSMLPAPMQRGYNPRKTFAGEYDPEHPLISPINGDYRGLPPLYAQVSDSEMLLDDCLRMARRAHTYDVEVDVDIWRNVPHVHQMFQFLPESREAFSKIAEFMRRIIPDGKSPTCSVDE